LGVLVSDIEDQVLGKQQLWCFVGGWVVFSGSVRWIGEFGANLAMDSRSAAWSYFLWFCCPYISAVCHWTKLSRSVRYRTESRCNRIPCLNHISGAVLR